jgi:hypothetical protein
LPMRMAGQYLWILEIGRLCFLYAIDIVSLLHIL